MPANESRMASLLTFDLEGQRSAVLASEVVEVQRAVAMTRLPRGPPLVEGVIDLRGTIVPVLDIRARLGLPEHALTISDQFVIVRVQRADAGFRVVAIRVNRALELLAVPRAQIDDAPFAEGATGLAKLADGLVLIHDLQRFLSLEDQLSLDRALAGGPA